MTDKITTDGFTSLVADALLQYVLWHRDTTTDNKGGNADD